MFRSHREVASEKGSGVVGFILVAPLIVTIFICVGQIAILVGDKSTLNSAAAIGARAASAADASNADGRSAVLDVLASRGSGFKPESIVISQIRNQELMFVVVSVTRKVEIPFLGKKFLITGRARAIDEALL